MWRLFQGISRNIRGQWNGSFRSAPQTVCHEDEKEAELLARNLEKTCHPTKKELLQTKVQSSICKQCFNTEDNEDGEWYRNNFHHNFWQQECQHCNFIEALGLGTALLLGCKLSQLWKLKLLQEKRKQGEDKSSWTQDLYKAAFREDGWSATNYVILPQGKRNTHSKLESDVCWAKTPPSNEKSKRKDVGAQRIKSKNSSWTSEIESLKYSHHDTSKEEDFDAEKAESATDGASKESDIFEDFSNEWGALCRQYDGILYNNEGLRQAKSGNYSKAIQYWKKGCDLGCSKAAFNIGLCYETGTGIPISYEKAVEFYSKAADGGNAVAAYNLALMYINSQCNMEKEISSKDLLSKAADQGLAEAQTELGMIYSEQGDLKSAADLFNKAAKQKDSSAQYFLGLCYENGWGVPENTCKAAELYSQASKEGHMQASYNLANFFEHGIGGIPEDKHEALKMYEQCAKKGHSLAAETSKKLKKSLESAEDDMLSGMDGLHLKISQSAPALSSYLRHHITEFGTIDWEAMSYQNVLSKSSTMENFNTQNAYKYGTSIYNDDDLYSYGSSDSVQFSIGDEDSCSDDSNSDSFLNYFSLEGNFGEVISRPKGKNSVSFPKMHKSPSFDNLSEFSVDSDGSDLSIVFDDHFQGIQLTKMDPGSMNNKPTTGIDSFLNDRIDNEYGNHKFSGFDVFGGSCLMDELSDSSQHTSLTAVATM